MTALCAAQPMTGAAPRARARGKRGRPSAVPSTVQNAAASSAQRAAFNGDAMVRPARISRVTVYHAAAVVAVTHGKGGPGVPDVWAALVAASASRRPRGVPQPSSLATPLLARRCHFRRRIGRLFKRFARSYVKERMRRLFAMPMSNPMNEMSKQTRFHIG